MTTRLLASAAALALIAGSAEAFTLDVLHVNDFHSRIEPINAFDSTCPAADDAAGKCFGGVARLATMINGLRGEIRSAGGNVLVLDAGDPYQGSLYYTTYKGKAEAEFMQAIGFDAMAVGNHEFDDGPEGLANLLDIVTFPVISSNLDVSQSNVLAGRIAKHAVLEVGGRKVGIVSALTRDTIEIASPGPTVIFQEEIEALRAAVADLEGQGVNVILALTHVGLPADLEIAARVAGVDAVIGGHSHTYLSASNPARHGAYPTWVTQDDGTAVPVVQAYAYGKYVGHLTLEFDDAGRLLHAGGDTMLVDASVAPDPAIAARVAELGGPIEELKARVVATTAAPIDGSRDNCRARECEMGNLVADAILARAAGQGVQIVFQNGGGLRASIDAGEVTMGEVLAVLPFQNTLATFQLTGAGVLAALENGVSDVESGAGRFPQVAGLSYAFDPAAPKGARVSEVNVREGDAWVPLDPARVYGVAANNFMRAGGDGYRVFATEAVNPYDFGPDLADVLAEYLAANAPFAPALDGRIRVK
ncbi:MAG: 5'-nucleotidase C-terminal domain-containing protein [Rhodobacteraceae bacterium]|jgi:5'-nucleotidase|nr:5'-nucleotidase C-terminal domain-containing protein [Paracoccaceae bacterium]